MFNLRWYQKKPAPIIFEYWRRNKYKNPLIAIPTGAGKTIIIADIIHQAITNWDINVLILSHRKEILSQNKDTLVKYLNQFNCNIPIGIYSAGLGQRDIKKITIAGIQSIYRKLELFKDFNLIIIDEAHLIPPTKSSETMYVKVLQTLNNAKCVGLTATPYRLGTGYIIGDGHIFDDLVFDITSKGNFNRLVKENYLTNLISKRTQTELDAEGTKIIAGDYSEKELALKFNKEQITEAAVSEIVEKGKDYKKWLIFAINIEHAESIASMLADKGITAIPVHSKMDMQRGPIIEAFKVGKIRALVNVNILTVGIDVPDIDLIALLRPTKSPSLYVQAVGRGLRVYPEKKHCLVLDFARIVSTLGPVNDVRITKKRKGKGGQQIMKTCPQCDTLCVPSARICPTCEHKFEFAPGINTTSDKDSEIVATDKTLWYDVSEVYYKKHEKRNSPSSIKVTYLCGLNTFNEWIGLEHKGWFKQKSNMWMKKRSNGYNFTDELNNVDSTLKVIDGFLKPKRIKVKKSGKYPEIIDYEF